MSDLRTSMHTPTAVPSLPIFAGVQNMLKRQEL
jgi:hypothetical protein